MHFITFCFHVLFVCISACVVPSITYCIVCCLY